jgi:acetyl-CoA acetyltransferase
MTSRWKPGEPVLAIVGASHAPSQGRGTFTPAGLMAEAAAHALADAGVDRGEVDGLFSASAYLYMPTLTLGEYLGIRPRFSDSTTVGGASFLAHLRHAAAAIAAGCFDVGLIAYGSTQRSDGNRYVKSMTEPLAYEVPIGARWPIAGYAMMAQRHMHEFGTTSEQLAEVAVASRQWALLNPDSGQSTPLTVEDVVTSPMISSPLHRFDCCLVSDGGGALVVTSPERARDLTEHPVYVTGIAETHWARNVSGIDDFTSVPAADTAPEALGQAGLSLSDIDVFELYDSFTIAVLLSLEAIGLCGRGEGGAFVEQGVLRPGGKVPTNTNGGGLSCRHPGMLGMHLALEGMTQLRGRAGARQVEGARRALVHGLGGVHMTGVTAVLSTEPSG